MINIKHFDRNLLKIDQKSYKFIDIHYIGYVTMRDSDYLEINSISSLNCIINEVDGCIEKINGKKYLTLVSTDKNKAVLTKYIELWNEIKTSIEKINNKSGQ